VDTVINTYPHPHTNLTSEENSEHLYLERVWNGYSKSESCLILSKLNTSIKTMSIDNWVMYIFVIITIRSIYECDW
jgi:hypothetical protein